MNIKKYKNIFLIIASILLVVAVIYIFMPSRAATGQNDFTIQENGNLEYYITVKYDGKDEATVTSDDTATATVFSDYIYVEDKLPQGVTYAGVIGPSGVNNWDCTYGAVERNDRTKACSGYVVGAGTENNQCVGVNYDSATRIVSFAVKDLQAGCELTVGIATTTGTLGSNSRIDLYNTAYAWEEKFTAQSNPVHVFMGSMNVANYYQVSYNITGINGVTMPDNPNSEVYAPGQTVGVARAPVLEGYTFNGWTTSNATVSNGTFTMPSNDVTFTGSFTKKTEYTVTYQVNIGAEQTGYVAPAAKSYGQGDNVTIADVSQSSITGDYTFNGWTTGDVADISSGKFTTSSGTIWKGSDLIFFAGATISEGCILASSVKTVS